METEKEQMEKAIKNMNKRIEKTYKPSLWYRFKDAVAITFLAFLVLVVLIGFIVLLITLIENPTSLAIICATGLLAIFFGFLMRRDRWNIR